MKPDWKDAPEWARWLCCGKSGVWWWYEREPIQVGGTWFVMVWDPKDSEGRIEKADCPLDEDNTHQDLWILEKRPK